MQDPPRRRKVLARRIARYSTALAIVLVAAIVPGSPAAARPATPAAPASGQPTWSKQSVAAGCAADTDPDPSDDTPFARCFAAGLATSDGKLVEQTDEPVPGALGPADIQSAYGLTDTGQGGTVAVVDAFGYRAAESDLAVFRAHYGLPPCTTENGCFTKLDQRGGDDYPKVEDPGWSIETALDLDAVSAACPSCDILLVQADDNGFPNLGQAVDTAAARHPAAISNSYGVDGEIPYEAAYYDQYYDHPGIAVTVSTGDTGGVQSYPATSPDVVAVGGTTLTRDPSTARGWTETAWAGGGSGCSRYEAAPDFQQPDVTGCAGKRATADVAADADSATGLAVYNTLGQDGWSQYGGTSLSSPLVAAMYALAGPAIPGTYPASYVYRAGASLFDVTKGANQNCGTIECTAGAGWDGPTGVGTPNGLSALTLGPAAAVAGTVTAGRKPLAGARVTLTASSGYRFHGVTDAHGRYHVPVAAGTYQLTVSEFGYGSAGVDKLSVAAGKTVTRGFALDRLANRRVSGVVRDGSGQRWPIYAKITIDGDPNGAVYTDPVTGRYSVELPVGSRYSLGVEPVDMPGYQTRRTTVDLRTGHGRVTHDIGLAVDATTCTAPGYAYTYDGVAADFEGWSGAADGWQVTDEAGTGKTWVFDDPGGKGNRTGGGGQFAIVDNWVNSTTHDSSLVSPALDFSDQTSPEIGFDTYYYDYGFGNQDGDVDLSLDGGSTWTNVWHAPDTMVQGPVRIPVPQAAGKPDVRFRFRFTGSFDNYWELDDVFAGSRSCDATKGGLVVGTVHDDNTGAPLTGAEVTAPGGVATVTQPTVGDAAVDDGFYWLYVPGTGTTRITAAGRHYVDSAASVRTAAHRVVRQDWRLRAGRVQATPGAIDVTASADRGGQRGNTRTLRLRNTGRAPATVRIVEQDRGFTSPDGKRRAASPGAPAQRVKVDANPFAFGPSGHVGGHDLPPREAAVDPAWDDLPTLPRPIQDSVVATEDGIVYSVGGLDDSGITREAYAYDSAVGKWQAIAPLPAARENAVGGFVNGRLYVAGGWDGQGNPSASTFVYDPATDHWSTAPDLPAPKTAAAGAVSGGRLYVVAGCTTVTCDSASSVYAYDPHTATWSRSASYPEDEVLLACAASGEGLVCAGGRNPAPFSEEIASTAYRYDAGSDAWTQIASMPYGVWGASYAGSGGKLQLVGGIATYDHNTGASYTSTNQAIEFDPETGAWSALPNARYAVFRGGAACGLTAVGGSIGSFTPVPYAERLPGQGDCVTGSDVGWLSTNHSEVTIPAGRTVTVQVVVDTSATSSRGTYSARLAFVTDTPYDLPPVDVTLSRK
ncbi:carboxypeptidase regulatory-like domain-containing protein [Actinocatenispora sera]|uniref:Peptidase S53 domain-containing protein n=1 Tax=Actinocatenispora sera TaxID=390989 RepID=A0A810L3A5_9ACTN|nr:kelch repeat-containing protein [Actinocatenispora sera]BCJ29385.1 hypothetical protein Asera_34930 [Actinocatenispora sera]